jgi:hypothetical protein
MMVKNHYKLIYPIIEYIKMTIIQQMSQKTKRTLRRILKQKEDPFVDDLKLELENDLIDESDDQEDDPTDELEDQEDVEKDSENRGGPPCG